ncbi:MAG: YjjG family noncanonical pyrimidine nucleotidase [Clostridia bacterium]|nr:YjjG family noncanonical pyrimidine nucleotidase [Clostridia bacterium]
MGYTTIFLDMDRTIFDFDAAEKDSFFRAYEDHIAPCNEEIYKKYQKINSFYWKEFEKGTVDIKNLKKMRFDDLFNELGISFSGEKFNDYYIGNLSCSPQLYDGAKELCQYLKSKYKVIILTNGIAKNQKNRLKLSGIDTLSDGVVISEEVGVAKPHEKIFQAAMDLSGEKEKKNIIMIGDDLSADIKGAWDFGIDTLWTNYKKVQKPDAINPTFEVYEIHKIKEIL